MSFVDYYVKGLVEKPIYMYTPEESEEYQKYITNKFGKIEKVFHELYSPDVHIDILVIAPTKEQNYYKLITEGVGAYKMNVPSQFKEYELERNELVMFLPPEWNMDFKDEKYNWVLGNIKTIARLPIEEKSWIGFGHTFAHSPTGDQTFSNTTKFVATLLINATDYSNNGLDFHFKEKGKINLCQLIPLYKEEYLYYQNNGIKKLFDIFDNKGLSLIVNNERPNCCEQNIINTQKIEEDLEIEK